MLTWMLLTTQSQSTKRLPSHKTPHPHKSQKEPLKMTSTPTMDEKFYLVGRLMVPHSVESATVKHTPALLLNNKPYTPS